MSEIGRAYNVHRAVMMCLHELAHAEEKHPEWPSDTVHSVAILIEEAGEAMQAALNYHYENGDIKHLKKELAQVGAMAIRNLVDLPQEESDGSTGISGGRGAVQPHTGADDVSEVQWPKQAR